MVKKKVSLLRNKKGHPIYSREDIREQYCITQKELEVLENAKRNRLFSCLAGQSNIFCDSTSSIFSCIAKNRASSEEKLNRPLPSFSSSTWSNHHPGLSGAGNFSDDDDEFLETSFRRRPKSVCLSDSKFRLALLVDECGRTKNQINSPNFESSGSLGSSSHCSANSKSVNRGLGFTRPYQLQLGSKDGSSFTPSQSVDSLSEDLQRKEDAQGPQVEKRISKTPDLSVDERKQKHVSFDSSSLVRSNTISEIETEDNETVSVTSIVNAQKNTTPNSEQNRSHERLLDTPLKFSIEMGDDRLLTNQSSQINSKCNILGRQKKAPMRAQATQTDASVNIRFAIPAYLTLSPRATAPPEQWHHGSQYNSSSVLNKTHSSCDKLDKDDSEEELLEVDLTTKQHRFLSVIKQKIAQEERAIDADSEAEIMVSFKPYHPSEQNKEEGKDSCSVQDVKQHHKTLCRKLSLESAKSYYLKRLCDPYGNLLQQSVHKKFHDSLVSYFKKQSIDQETFRADGEKKNENSQELIKQKELDIKLLPIGSSKEDVDFISVVSETGGELADCVQKSFKGYATGTNLNLLNQSAPVKYILEQSQESPSVTTDATLQRESFPRTTISTPTCSLYEDIPEFDSTGCGTNSDGIVSPDSESSSSHFTEQETSRSDMSTSSSNFAIRSELSNRSETECEEISASSEYVTANEHSNQERENRDVKLTIVSNNNSSSSTRCRKTDSSLSSNSHGLRRRKRTQPFAGGKKSEHVVRYVTVTKNTIIHLLSSNNSTDHVDSSEESTKKEFSSSDSELGKIPEIPIYEAAIEDECDHTGDVTPVLAPSPDPSSMQDATTVIENRSDGTSGDLVESLHDSLGCQLENMTDSDSQEIEPNPVLDQESNIEIDKTTQKRVKISEEVVSYGDLTERPSQDDDSSAGQINQHVHIVCNRKDEISDQLPNQNVEKVSSSSEYVFSEATTPSLDSSTSESFILDNGVDPRSEMDKYQFDEIKELDDNFEGFIQDICPSELDQIKPRVSVSPTKSSESIDTDKDIPSEVTSSKTDSPAPADNQSSHSTSTTHSRDNEGAIPKHTSVYHEIMRLRRRDREKPRQVVVTPEDSDTHHCLILEKSQNRCSVLNMPSYVRKDFRSYICNYCGDKITQQDQLSAPSVGHERHFWKPSIHNVQPMIRKARNRETSKHTFDEQYGRQGHKYTCQSRWDNAISSVEAGILEDEEKDAGLHLDSYFSSFWIYIGPTEELAIWNQLLQKNENDYTQSPLLKSSDNPSLQRSESIESTLSEREFRKQYKAVTHRLVHRKSSMELYSRLASRKLEVDKHVTIQRKNGEFGFRIHGSRPVVVSAIEPGTPADRCGLEIGDIIISVNGMRVLDATHSDVVKAAHAGSDTLCLELARTCHLLTPDERQPSQHALLSGFLQRLSIDGDTRRWCRRWFVLKTDNCLYWYKTPQISDLAGALVIHNHIIARVPGSGSSNTFRVSRHGLPHLYFAADDEQTANRWISSLSDAASNICHVDRYLELCLTNVHSPALTFPKPDCEGYLRRLGSRWKRRYFLLKDGSLYLYLDRSSPAATGWFK
ncbi:uncharacterized protein LOC106470527 isoform X2 [Limulus polyphemus]|nr:uncharacterized protein LOC106470527 isoform X2 [Limulus polyphemus]